MSRFREFVQFLEYDKDEHLIIDPEKRRNTVRENLFEIIRTYQPKVIVMAGLGSGSILYDIMKEFQALIVVVEPSFKIIDEFVGRHRGDDALNRVRFINGDFKEFPVDYYKADLLVAVDIFDLIETGPVIDEFRRALQFEGILFLGLVVLQNEDIEGRYDEFMHEISSLHNDFYLEEDLKTILDLNEFAAVKSIVVHFDEDIRRKGEYLDLFYKKEGFSGAVLERYREELERLYGLRDGAISEPYYIGVHQRRKPQ